MIPRSRRAWLVLTLTVALAGTAGSALAATYGLKPSSTWTGASGVTGTGSKVAELDPANGTAYTKIYYREQSDRPYLLRLRSCKLQTGRDEGCDDKDLDLGTKSIGTFNSETAELGDGNFITSIQVCTNSKPNNTEEEEIKGLRVWGSRLETNGSLSPNGSPIEFKLPNCSKWHTKVSCDAKSVASGFRGYYSQKGFSGIAMRCNEINPDRGMSRSRP